MRTSLLLLVSALSLRVSCYPSNLGPPGAQPDTHPSTPPPVLPTVYSPVMLNQLCQEPNNYCIYVDQIRPGTVRASPVNATDSQGAFLFERAAYLTHPFHVCYAGCCIDLDFATKPGCVTMRYVSRQSNETGHLLARFADDVQAILGPRDDMAKELQACPTQEVPALPYAVIGARGGHEHKQQQQQQQQQGVTQAGQMSHVQQDPAQAHLDAGQSNLNPPTPGNKAGHDYFDDVTVPLADLI